MERRQSTHLHGAWWGEPENEAHREVANRMRYLTNQSQAQREEALFHLNIFSNFNVDGDGTVGADYMPGKNRKIRRNICAAAVDTAASMIAAGRTMPLYLTSGADFQLSRRAEQRSRCLHSQFYDLGVFDIGADVFCDGAVTGTGIVKAYRDASTNKPKLKRRPPNSVFVDLAEGRDPRSYYDVDHFAREVMIAQYPEHRDFLFDSSGPRIEEMSDFFIRVDSTADVVRVVEAWHMPTTEDGDDGRHVICVDNCTLLDEP